MKQIIKHIFLIFLITSACGLNKTDDFNYVDRTSTIDKNILRNGDEFKMTLTLINPDSKTKELTFFKDFNASVQIWCSWYCDSQIQHSHPRIFKQEPDRTDKYLVKLLHGDSISFDLTGKFLIENDTFKIVFDKHKEILYLPKLDCDSILKCQISGMWMPGRPYLADSYEYPFNSNTLTIDIFDNNETIPSCGFSDIFEKTVKTFPNDSASLHRFYFKWNSTKDQDKITKQIKRLENLNSNKSVEKYRNVEKNLKPLMTKIVNSNTVTKSQSDSLVELYSLYDYFSGESLLSTLLSNDENYNLVWKSFQIMTNESSKDTCFITGLIKLDNNIRTNAELAQAMGDFKLKAIRNNPIGFLEMYAKRQPEQRRDFANNISVWDDVDKDLIEQYSEISKESKNEKYRKLATELVERFKNE